MCNVGALSLTLPWAPGWLTTLLPRISHAEVGRVTLIVGITMQLAAGTSRHQRALADTRHLYWAGTTRQQQPESTSVYQRAVGTRQIVIELHKDS